MSLVHLHEAKQSVAGKLAAAREAYQAASYELVSRSSDPQAQKRVAELAKRIDGCETELRTIDAAIEHAEKLAEEERRVEHKRARQRAAEDDKRRARAELQRIDQQVERAGKIDKLIDELGAEHRQWPGNLFAPSERDRVASIIVNRLVAVGILPERFITGPLSANLEIRVRDVVHAVVAPSAVALNNKLQHNEIEV